MQHLLEFKQMLHQNYSIACIVEKVSHLPWPAWSIPKIPSDKTLFGLLSRNTFQIVRLLHGFRLTTDLAKNYQWKPGKIAKKLKAHKTAETVKNPHGTLRLKYWRCTIILMLNNRRNWPPLVSLFFLISCQDRPCVNEHVSRGDLIGTIFSPSKSWTHISKKYN